MTNKTILITGCASGIGNHLTLYLAERGFTVIAGVRKIDDLTVFSGLSFELTKNIITLQLDVTNLENIEYIKNYLHNHKINLYAIVNNAGVGDLGFLHSFTEEEMYRIFNVNTFGPWRLTNAMLPFLLKSKGRIVNISSQGGMITKALYGPYSMTKFALESYTDALREELAPHGLKVSVVQPGGIRTGIGDRSQEGILKRLENVLPEFKETAQMIINSFSDPVTQEFNPDLPESNTNRRISHPIIVSEAVYDALTNDDPKHRYLVGTEWEGMRVFDALFTKILDENNNPVHNFSKEELLNMFGEKINFYNN